MVELNVPGLEPLTLGWQFVAPGTVLASVDGRYGALKVGVEVEIQDSLIRFRVALYLPIVSQTPHSDSVLRTPRQDYMWDM